MNSPTMPSTPGSSGGRPATVAPNTTSVRPVIRASRSAHAPCTTVFTVSPCVRASSVTRRFRSSGMWVSTLSGTTGTRAGSAGATSVGSSVPASSERQASRAASLSWRFNQARYSRYEVTRRSPRASPPAAYTLVSSSSRMGIDQPSMTT